MVGSRLGTHALWTVALSAVITLLALAPMILPGDRPLDSFRHPLRGTGEIGEVVANPLAPPSPRQREPAEPDRAQPRPHRRLAHCLGRARRHGFFIGSPARS